MKNRQTYTQLNVFEQIKPSLPKMRAKVYNCFGNERLTSFEVARKLNLPINHVVGRINELRYKNKLIVGCGVKNNRTIYKIRENEPYDKRPLSIKQKLKIIIEGDNIRSEIEKLINEL